MVLIAGFLSIGIFQFVRPLQWAWPRLILFSRLRVLDHKLDQKVSFCVGPIATGLGFENCWGQRQHLLLVVCRYINRKTRWPCVMQALGDDTPRAEANLTT